MVFILSADNEGEGGILALTALLGFNKNKDIVKKGLKFVPVGLFGAALLFGDGVITPAISVLSAVEGLTVAAPHFEPFVIPLTLVIIIILFMAQHFGTGKLGTFFGPIVLLWFFTIGALGVHGVWKNTDVLFAFNPMYAVDFFIQNGREGFFVLSSVFLVVTGGEALYADLGHFGKIPIRLIWFALVLPSLLLNYLGQGALLLTQPEAATNPFFLLAPPELVLPLTGIATAATVIASQALISGVFSLTRQAVQLGYLPRLNIVHTSHREMGQIYVPSVNWALMVGVLWLVIEFKSSSELASAYGAAIILTMAITTFLATAVAWYIWKWPWYKTVPFIAVFLALDVVFIISSAPKVPDGGWVALAMGGVVYLLMTTWSTGRKILREHLKKRSQSVDEFLQRIKAHPPTRVPGTAIYMSGDPWGIPLPLLHNLKHNKVMHERIAILTITTAAIPVTKKTEFLNIEKLAPNFYRIVAKYGFTEAPKITEILDYCKTIGIDFSLEDTTFFLGRETILASGHPGMAIWREKLFAVMSRNAQRPTNYYGISSDQVIEVGIQVEI